MKNPASSAFACLVATVFATAFALAPATSRADDAYPSKPIHIITTTAAGGSLDAMARVLGEKITLAWHQQVIVEAKPGANGMLGTSYVAKSPPDGYTVLFSISAVVQNVLLQPDPPYKLSDLAPVSMFAVFPFALVTSATVPVTTLAEYVALAKQKPKTLTFGSYGIGSSAHIAGESLNRSAGIDILHVPYKGEAALFPDLASGQLSSAYGTVGFFGRQVKTGKVRLIAVANPTRLRDYPDLPTFAEAGYPKLNLPGWGGIFMPAGTPPDIVRKFSQLVHDVVQMPDVQAKIYDLGYEPSGMLNDAFAKKLQTEVTSWGALIKDTGIKLE